MFPRISDIFNTYFGTTLSWPVYTYGFFLATAFACAFFIVYLELKRKSKSGIIPAHSEKFTISLAALILISAFIGLKIAHLLDYPEQFREDPWKAITSTGGFSFYGGLIGGTIAVIVFSLQIKLPLLQAGNIAAPSICLGYAIGRMGCHLSGDGCWGVENPNPQPDWLSFLPGYFWTAAYPHNAINEGIPIAGCLQEHCHVLPVPAKTFPMKARNTALLIILGIIAFFMLTSEQTTCDPKHKEDDVMLYEDCIPIVDFSADKVSFYPGDWVNFQFTGDLGSENDVNYHWILPGSNYNSVSGTRFLTVIYTSVGTYDATLIVTNDCGKDTLVKPAYIEVKPY